MNRNQIRAALLLKGVTLTAIARKCGVSTASVSRVIARQTTSKRIRAAIADAIGRPEEEVFGGRGRRAG